MFLSAQEELESRGVTITHDPVGPTCFYAEFAEDTPVPLEAKDDPAFSSLESAVAFYARIYGISNPQLLDS